MEIRKKACGEYYTNCYIVKTAKGEIIIDPGISSYEWVSKNVENPIAILNTHGHFDHIWDNASLKKRFNIPIIIHHLDNFWLGINQFGLNTPTSKADILIEDEENFQIGDTKLRFLHFPGHTPGCCAIEIGDNLFCGDFVFKNSIGRVDLPYSDKKAMKESLKKAKKIQKNYILYPGHGENSTLFEEKKLFDYWIEIL
jgi:glyoxylase-like metal-dependent hydrolase (beta-lactamase superfamily II)